MPDNAVVDREVVRELPPGNLPVEASSFVGRERELAEVQSLLASGRLLTLTGPGGCGKTRLALATAGLAEGFRGGIFWVELASISDGRLVPESVARTLGVSWGTGLSATEALLNHLKPKETLLVLDNCEHLVAACAGLADTLLRFCPRLKILATSREALHIPGERAWPVPSLSLPEPRNAQDPEEAARYEAVRLFVERAATVTPGFALTPQNAADVARVCQRLDGIPLAIELAAARTRLLTPAQIAARLDDRFLLLAEGSRVVLPRQRTLKATMDWSHDLLSEEERALFRRLSVFVGGFTLEAAEAVCPAGGLGGGEFLELLSRLVDKSLVLVTWRGDEVRYGMLETVLRYASERLGESGEAESARRAHAGFFLRLAEEAELRLTSAEQGFWTERLDADHGNLRAALGWFAERDDYDSVLRMAGALWWYWFLRGRYVEGRGWLEAALARADGAPAAHQAKALTAAGDLAFLQSEYARANELLGEGLTLYRDLKDERGVASAVQLLGSIAREQGRYEQAEAFHGESLAISRRLGDDWGVAQSLNYLGFVAWLRGDHGRAAEVCAQAASMFEVLGDVEGIAWSKILRGGAALDRGERGQARDLLEDGLALARQAGYRESVAWALDQLGVLALREGEDERTAALFRESLTLHRDLGDRWRTSSLLEESAGVASSLGRFERAAILFGAAEALREALSDPVPPRERAERERGVKAAQEGMDERSFRAAWEAGRATSLERIYEYALAEEGPQASAAPAKGSKRLSAREADVLGLVAEGLTDSEVADRLYLSPRTVGQHLRSAYRKLGVKSRAAATRAAIERGLI